MLQDTICDIGNLNMQSFTILVLEGYGLISIPAQEADLGVGSWLDLTQNKVLTYIYIERVVAKDIKDKAACVYVYYTMLYSIIIWGRDGRRGINNNAADFRVKSYFSFQRSDKSYELTGVFYHQNI